MSKIFVSFLLSLLFLGADYAFADSTRSADLLTSAQKHFDKNEYGLARADWQKAAGQGNTQAMDKLADMYASGTGVKLDYAKAMKYWRRAADKNDGDAMYEISISYDMGRSVPQDRKEGSLWFHKALDQCNGQAAAQILLMSHEPETTIDKAITCLRKSANAGDYTAMLSLAGRNDEGQNFLKNPLEAISFGHIAIDAMQKKADAGDVRAMCDMGKSFFNGVGTSVPRDPVRGLQLCEEGAAHGDTDAMEFLISIYLLDDKYQDYKKVNFWNEKLMAQYTLRAQRGDVSSMLKLANKYYRPPSGTGENVGILIPGAVKDAGKAVSWANKAAALGSREALFLLGYIYEDQGMHKDNPLHDCKKARGFFDKAAALGDLNAISRLSERAKGVPILDCDF
jgi:TPR repeat protein